MLLDRVPLRFSTAEAACLREVCGRDEESIAGLATADALGLIERLCVAGEAHALAAGDVARLCAHDRDRLLAAIYVRAFGARHLASCRCDRCGALFDFELRIDELQRLLAGERREAPGWLLQGSDELAVARLPAGAAVQELERRCLERGADAAKLDETLEELAPLLALDLHGVCPECGASQTIAFDIQRLLLGELRDAQTALWQDVHALASAYHWSFTEIIDLPRSRRRLLAAQQAMEAGT